MFKILKRKVKILQLERIEKNIYKINEKNSPFSFYVLDFNYFLHFVNLKPFPNDLLEIDLNESSSPCMDPITGKFFLIYDLHQVIWNGNEQIRKFSGMYPVEIIYHAQRKLLIMKDLYCPLFPNETNFIVLPKSKENLEDIISNHKE